MRLKDGLAYNGTVLRIYILKDRQYIQSSKSNTFVTVPVTEIPRFIQQTKQVGQIATIRTFRAWIRQQISSLEQ